MKIIFGGGLLAVAAMAAPSTATDFHLVCDGGGAAVKHHAVHAFVRNSEGQTAAGTAVQAYDRNYADQVKVDVVGGAGRVRLPRGLLPPLHGGEGGWFELRDVSETENELTASVAVNFANHPKLRIDRLAGAIAIDGKAGTFNGRCRPYDPANVERAF